MSGTNELVTQPANDSLPAPFVNIPADDPDRAALEQALAEINGTADANPTPAPAVSQETDKPAATVQDKPDPADGQPMVPLARFQQVNRARDEAIARAQYLEGALAAMQQQLRNASQQPAQPQQQQQQQQATAMQRLMEAEKALVELADEWESGQGMTAGEMEQKRLVLLGRILNTRDELFAQRLMGLVHEVVEQSIANHTGLVDGQALEAQIGVLEAKHPWLKIMPDESIKAMEEIARAEGAAIGKPYGHGPAEVARLRARIAVLSDRYGPEWFPDMTPPAAAAPDAKAPVNTKPQPASAGHQVVAPNAADRLAAMQARAAHPPNEPTNRSTADVTLTLDALDAMSDEQIENGLSVDRLRAIVGLPPRR
jgi:hypothetical protein